VENPFNGKQFPVTSKLPDYIPFASSMAMQEYIVSGLIIPKIFTSQA